MGIDKADATAALREIVECQGVPAGLGIQLENGDWWLSSVWDQDKTRFVSIDDDPTDSYEEA